MAYETIAVGEEVPSPRVVEWVRHPEQNVTADYRADFAHKGAVIQVDLGLHGLVMSGEDKVMLDYEITPTGGFAYQSTKEAQRAVDIASRILELY